MLGWFIKVKVRSRKMREWVWSGWVTQVKVRLRQSRWENGLCQDGSQRSGSIQGWGCRVGRSPYFT